MKGIPTPLHSSVEFIYKTVVYETFFPLLKTVFELVHFDAF